MGVGRGGNTVLAFHFPMAVKGTVAFVGIVKRTLVKMFMMVVSSVGPRDKLIIPSSQCVSKDGAIGFIKVKTVMSFACLNEEEVSVFVCRKPHLK
jgi:hypothetical protein